MWESLWDWNAMANGNCVVSYQDVFHYKLYDSLALSDTQRISCTAQAGEERRKSLRQAQEGRSIVGLVGDCLQLGTERLFTLAQCRHALPQLLDRHERFLVGAEKSFDALANMRCFSLQALLAFPGRIGRTRGCQPAVELLLDQRGVFQQSYHLGPDDPIEQILPNDAAVIANRTAQFAPAI